MNRTLALKKLHALLLLHFLGFMLIWLKCNEVSAQSQSDNQKILSTFIPETGVSLEQLSQGEVGQGTILYYRSDVGMDKPSLVVKLKKATGAKVAVGEVYQAVSGTDYVEIRIQENTIVILNNTGPSITLTSLDGWWVKNNRPEYNLNIQINGPMYAMWGAGYEPTLGFTGWASEVKIAEASVYIEVRDPENKGVPLWDWRSLLPAFPRSGYLRTNYAERECNTTLELNLGITSLWPYVAEAGGYEQPVSKLLPPIVVDWNHGKITHFSELVTARNQNCSYTLYSLDRLQKEQLNQTNFESPFAFYDLSGEGNGHPNLILRTQHFPANDPWSIGDIDAQIQNPYPKDMETIRYSWRNVIGDLKWDFKIEVMGFQKYNSNTPIAGGLIHVDAPNYQTFPHWVVGQSWPLVTFIGNESSQDLSSEGIYDWSPREADLKYYFGWDNALNQKVFTTINQGLRGEYRLGENIQPFLYISAVDRKLHLLNAEAGVWSIDNKLELNYTRLKKDGYIDQWVYRTKGDQNLNIISQLNVDYNYLIYSSNTEIIIRQAFVKPSLFETLPPTNHDEWAALGAKLEAKKPQFEPQDFKAMLHQFEGPELAITNARLQDYRLVEDKGFRFVLKLLPGYQLTGPNLVSLEGLAPGDYAVEYNYTSAIFKVTPLTPANLTASISSSNLTELSKSLLTIQIENTGLKDASSGLLELSATSPSGKNSIIITESVNILSGEPYLTKVSWAANEPGKWILELSLKQSDHKLQPLASRTLLVASAGQTRGKNLLTDSLFDGQLLILSGGLLTAGILAVVGLLLYSRSYPPGTPKDITVEDVPPEEKEPSDG